MSNSLRNKSTDNHIWPTELFKIASIIQTSKKMKEKEFMLASNASMAFMGSLKLLMIRKQKDTSTLAWKLIIARINLLMDSIITVI